MKTRCLALFWPLGLRVQLTLWYTAVFASLILLAGVLLYWNLQDSLAVSLDTTLQLRAEQIADGIVGDNGVISTDDLTGELPGFDPNTPERQMQQDDVNVGVLVRLLDAQGRTIHVTPAFRALQVPLVSVTQPLHGKPWQGTVTTQSGDQVRLYSRALIAKGRLFAVIQVGEPLAQLHIVFKELAWKLSIVGLFILLVSALGSYWLAGRAFVPVRQLIQAARTIKGGDLQHRVPVPSTHNELHSLALTLNEMIAALEQSFLRQRRFVAAAAHELRTPVAVIRSKADLFLLQQRSPQDDEIAFRAISQEAERLSRLISDLLALARGDEGMAHFEREPVRLDCLVEAVAENAELLAAEHEIHLSVQAHESVTVLGDEARLIQAVINLLDNAIIYTPAGGSVSIDLTKRQQQVFLAIRDTGIGIPTEHLSHIFERFYRVDPARTRREGGSSGLGLAVVEWVVHAHQGSVAVTSQVGQGSTFTVTLPAARTESVLLPTLSGHVRLHS